MYNPTAQSIHTTRHALNANASMAQAQYEYPKLCIYSTAQSSPYISNIQSSTPRHRLTYPSAIYIIHGTRLNIPIFLQLRSISLYSFNSTAKAHISLYSFNSMAQGSISLYSTARGSPELLLSLLDQLGVCLRGRQPLLSDLPQVDLYLRPPVHLHMGMMS